MTSQSAVPPTADQVTDYYGALGPLLQMAWGDNFHFGYWDGPSDTSSPEEATDQFTDLLTERLRVGPGDRVLDVGCGIGRPALRVASSTGADVLGITISRQQVEQASQLAETEGMSDQVSFQYADAMNMPFEEASFDAVLAFESIVHMDRPTALREMIRVLKPGGRLVLTDTFPTGDDKTGGDAGDVASLGRIEDYPGLVTDAGLRLDELTDVTEHTKFTFSRMLDGVFRCRREFERKHGVSVQEIFDSMKPAHPDVPTVSGTPGVGCLIMVAHKP
jgi:ubiquinone/menaquinone biosynthesis C-methylase UbiE